MHWSWHVWPLKRNNWNTLGGILVVFWFLHFISCSFLLKHLNFFYLVLNLLSVQSLFVYFFPLATTFQLVHPLLEADFCGVAGPVANVLFMKALVSRMTTFSTDSGIFRSGVFARRFSQTVRFPVSFYCNSIDYKAVEGVVELEDKTADS